MAAFRGETHGHHLAFASVELLWEVLTAKRWELLRTMTGQGGDVDPGSGAPYDAVHVDFTLREVA